MVMIAFNGGDSNNSTEVDNEECGVKSNAVLADDDKEDLMVDNDDD